MATDAIHQIDSGSNEYPVGTAIVAVRPRGTAKGSSSATVTKLANRFGKQALSDTELNSRLDDRFDDVRYYTGDATT